MHYFSYKHPKIFAFDFGDLKLRDLAKLWFFKLIMTKSNFKKVTYTVIFSVVIVIRKSKNFTKLSSQFFSI